MCGEGELFRLPGLILCESEGKRVPKRAVKPVNTKSAPLLLFTAGLNAMSSGLSK